MPLRQRRDEKKIPWGGQRHARIAEVKMRFRFPLSLTPSLIYIPLSPVGGISFDLSLDHVINYHRFKVFGLVYTRASRCRVEPNLAFAAFLEPF